MGRRITPRQALIRAIEKVGSQSELARRLQKSGVRELKRCRPQTVSYWINNNFIPAHIAIPIERITEGDVRRSDIAPSMYPELATG